MTIVGSKRMIVYDDVAQQEKIRIFDARVERPPHYDTFAEFHYAYHYGDTYAPYIKQEEPLKTECQHFLECIQHGKQPLTNGGQGLGIGQDSGGLLRIVEARRQPGGAAWRAGKCLLQKCPRPRLRQWQWHRRASQRTQRQGRIRQDSHPGCLRRGPARVAV